MAKAHLITLNCQTIKLIILSLGTKANTHFIFYTCRNNIRYRVLISLSRNISLAWIQSIPLPIHFSEDSRINIKSDQFHFCTMPESGWYMKITGTIGLRNRKTNCYFWIKIQHSLLTIPSTVVLTRKCRICISEVKPSLLTVLN